MKEVEERIKALVEMLKMSDMDFIDDYNRQNPDRYQFKYGESYSYRCGWTQAELESILTILKKEEK